MTMDLQPDPVEIDQLKDVERAWHDATYLAHAPGAYPASPEVFEALFVRQHLTAFCEGGWSWWADATAPSRRWAMSAVYACSMRLRLWCLGIFWRCVGPRCGASTFPVRHRVADRAAAAYVSQRSSPDGCRQPDVLTIFDLVVGSACSTTSLNIPESGRNAASAKTGRSGLP
jgi:hypothetical protein